MSVGQFFAEYWSVLLSALLTIASLIVAVIQAKRTGNKKGLLTLFAKIPQLVSEAERIFGAGNGQAKLNYVLTELRVYAIEHGIKTDTTELETQIENVVASTKCVNVETPSVEVKTEATADSTADIHASSENGATNNQVNVNI